MTNPLQVLTLDDLRRRRSVKWRAYPPDVLPAWVAEMDVPIAEPVAEALTEAIAIGDTGYAYGGEYPQALAEFAAERWGWRLDVAHTMLMPDVMRGVAEVLKLVTDIGDAVVVNPPVYPPFFEFSRHIDRRVIQAPLDDAYRIDLDVLDKAFAEATAGGRGAAYLLCSPHNPTGTVHTREELTAVAELAGRYGVRIVVDEIHAPLVYPGAVHVPFLSVSGSDGAFVLMSASKAWNLPGLKAAVAVAGPAAMADLKRLPEEVSHGCSHFGAISHTAALRYGRDWLDRVLVGLDANRRLLADLLCEYLPGVGYRMPQGTYLAWLDCRALDLPANPAPAFLHRGRVALSGGPGFGTGSSGHVRLNFATSPELLTEVVRRMAAAIS